MKITLKASEIKDVLNMASDIINTLEKNNNFLEGTKAIKFAINKDKSFIEITNYVNTLQYKINPISYDEEGTYFFRTYKFSEIIKTINLEEIEINIKPESEIALIKTGKGAFKVPMGVDPLMPDTGEFEVMAEINVNDFVKQASKVMFTIVESVSNSTAGLNIEISETGNIAFAGTDGYLIARTTSKQGKATEGDIRIAKEGLNTLRKLKGNAGTLERTASRIAIRTDLFTFITAQVAGKYVNYKNVIGTETVNSLKIDRRNFADILNMAAPLAGEITKDRKIEVDFAAGSGRMKIAADDNPIGKAELFITVQDPKNKNIGYKARLHMGRLQAIMKNIETDNIIFSYGENKGLYINPEGSEDLFFMMPMRK